MKISTKTRVKKWTVLIVHCTLLLNIVTFGSCSKESATVAYSYLSVINTAPTLATYNIYLDGTKINTSGAIAFGGVMAYSTPVTGQHTLKFTNESSTESLLTKTLSLSANTIYSAFLIGKDVNMDILLVTDEMNVSSTEKAFIRFINLSPDAPALDLSITGGETLISNKAYKSASAFQSIDPNTYSFDLKADGLVKTVLAEQTLTAGRYYTIISRGLSTVGEIDQPFGAQLITNL